MTHLLSRDEIQALRETLSCMDDDGQMTILCDMALAHLNSTLASFEAQELVAELNGSGR